MGRRRSRLVTRTVEENLRFGFLVVGGVESAGILRDQDFREKQNAAYTADTYLPVRLVGPVTFGA